MDAGILIFLGILSFVAVPAAIAATVAAIVHWLGGGLARRTQDRIASWSAPTIVLLLVFGYAVVLLLQPVPPDDVDGAGMALASLVVTGGIYFVASCLFGPWVARLTLERLRDE
jgi:hypothetical protein